MRGRGRAVGIVVATVLASGCSVLEIPYDTDDLPPRPPSIQTPTPQQSPEQSPEPAVAPFTGALAKGAKCVTLDADDLEFFESRAAVGGAITYPRGAMVRANDDWWAVAVATQVNPNNGGYTRDKVPPYEYFISTVPSQEYYEPTSTRGIAIGAGGEAVQRAHECLAKVPTPKPTPSPGSPQTYTGKLAKGATCKAVPADMLARLQQVGQVGGAITYPRGAMVRANAKWWTVIVATQVNANSSGLTEDNVPRTAYFVTNDPSYKGSSDARIVYFPLNPTKRDTAAARARRCLG